LNLKKRDKKARLHLFANPLANEKELSKIYKLLQKTDVKKLCKGTKTTNKFLRKDFKGICFIAGDQGLPFDSISHLPGYCDEKKIPYMFVPSIEDFSQALKSNIEIQCAFVKESTKDDENFEEYQEISKLMSKKL